MIFLGVTLMLVSMAWVLLDKKRSKEYGKQLEEKRQALEEIIGDAEQMIIELNKFSDYVTEQVSKKSEELEKNLKGFEEKLSNIKETSIESKNEDSNLEHLAVECTGPESFAEESEQSVDPPVSQEIENPISQPKKEEKVVPLNDRYKEVLNLSQKGYTQTDIAKQLNMGKGEIQLIIEMNR